MAKIIELKQRISEDGELLSEQKRIFTSQFDEEKGYLFWHKKNNIKIYNDVDFPECFSYSDQGRLQKLSRYIYSTTNMLAYRGNGGIKPYNKYQIGSLIGLKERALRDFMNKCKDNSVIAEVVIKNEDYAVTQYYMNPIYYFSSNRIPLNLYLIFQKSLDKHLKEWVKAEFNRIEENQNGSSK